jgi:hypothetical protein
VTLDEAKKFTGWLAGYVIFGWCIVFALWLLPLSRDTTDGEWPNRSGVRPRTDALTGCQYLETSKGGITPRINASGRHLGCDSQVE